MEPNTQNSLAIHEPITAIYTLTSIGMAGTEKFTELNTAATLAAIDNTTHHYSTLARSDRLADLIELQIQSLLPAAESAKAYFSQVFAFTRTTSHQFEQVLESQMSDIQDNLCTQIYAGLTVAEEHGFPAAKIVKESLMLTKETALSMKTSISRQLLSN